MWFFWLVLGLFILALFAILFLALRPGGVSDRRKKRWIAEREAGQAKFEDEQRRAKELTERNIAQWQEHRDKSQATEDPGPEA